MRTRLVAYGFFVLMGCGETTAVADAGDITIENCSPGCRDSDGRCRPGNGDSACGDGFGGFCSVCRLGERCLAQQCRKTCPSGCLLSDGQCASGTALSACGAEGRSCVACQTVERCVSGNCIPIQPAPTCGPMTCGGCCNGDECLSGNLDSACGSGGLFCVRCATTFERCQSSRCTLRDAGTVDAGP